MGFRDHFRRDKHDADELPQTQQEPHHEQPGAPPEFTFVRTTTNLTETIVPPTYDDHPQKQELDARLSSEQQQQQQEQQTPPKSKRKSFLGISVGSSPKKDKEASGDESNASTTSDVRRSSAKMMKRHSRSASVHSVNLPEDLPQIGSQVQGDDKEAAWERRAALLAEKTSRSRSVSPAPGIKPPEKEGDVDIQEAIRLHEEGQLERSTQLFGQLANPHGQNNVLAQVLYGLALRHGWGITPDPKKAIEYLALAAASSASIETVALNSGMKKGGSAKGELTLAIFELANCLRYGWGVDKKDPIAAFQYYLTAANLGDADAMNETAWCLLEGFGTKKDKFAASQWLRKAEGSGNKQIGNNWIWKEKYNPKA